MAPTDFAQISSFIYSRFGIKMPPAKKTMLEARLQKRLKALNFSSFRQYSEYVFSRAGNDEEVVAMVNAVTTNKTDFFRECDHFDFISSTALPELLRECHSGVLNMWSAGCSSGEEPYTMAMIFDAFNRQVAPFDYSILATDVCTEVLERGRLGVYTKERIESIPLTLKQNYFLKSKDPANKTVRVRPELRNRVTFQQLNFMDEKYPVRACFDLIMCRNVLIYFDRVTQEAVVNKLTAKLRKGGFLFLGHSESINEMRVPLVQVKPTIFRKLT
jgi:chemotaxis protein methyltransferase CheR